LSMTKNEVWCNSHKTNSITLLTVKPLKVATPIRPCLQRPQPLSFLSNKKSSLSPAPPKETHPSFS
jgi:hypothetical protein